MARPDDYAKTVNRYLELVANGSADDVTALYAEDATIEDPSDLSCVEAVRPSMSSTRRSKAPRSKRNWCR
jgi:ketosteroid isomerase-like protein